MKRKGLHIKEPPLPLWCLKHFLSFYIFFKKDDSLNLVITKTLIKCLKNMTRDKAQAFHCLEQGKRICLLPQFSGLLKNGRRKKKKKLIWKTHFGSHYYQRITSELLFRKIVVENKIEIRRSLTGEQKYMADPLPLIKDMWWYWAAGCVQIDRALIQVCD